MTTVYDYFTKKLGEAPDDRTLYALPVESNCGKDCVKVIDAAAADLQTFNVSDVDMVLRAANEAVAILWRG